MKERFEAIARGGGTWALLCWAAACGSEPPPPPAYPPPPEPSTEVEVLPPEEPAPAQEPGEPASEPSAPPVQVVPAERSPLEGAAPKIRFLAPRDGRRVKAGKLLVRLRLRGWDLQPAPGRHVHLILDNEPYWAIRDVSGPIDLLALLRERGGSLSEGTHVLRAFPSRAHHESVKEGTPFALVVFHYGKKSEGFDFDPSAPLLTYSRPKGRYPVGERILLDFYVANAELGDGAHRVRYEIDGRLSGEIASWVPHYIEHLPEGEHTVRLVLIGPDGQPVPGPFNDTTRTIQVGPEPGD